MRNTSLAIALVAAAATIALTRLTWAQPAAEDPATATQLFNDAQKMLDEERVAEACPKLAESQRLSPHLGTLLSLSECYDRLGKTASAWTALTHAIEMAAKAKDPRETEARSVLADLEKRMPRLKITVSPSAPADLIVRKDGDSLGRAAWDADLPIDPGTHVFAASAKGFEEWSTVVDAPPKGVSLVLAVPALRPVVEHVEHAVPEAVFPPAFPPAPVMISQPVPPATPPPSPSHALRTWGYVTGAVGGAALAAGVAFGLISHSKVSDRDRANACSATKSCTAEDKAHIEDLGSQAHLYATAANVAFAAGGAAVVAGVVMILVRPNRASSADGQMALSAMPLRDGGGISLAGRW